MPTVAYLANQFPAAVEPYVGEEIRELRRRGVRVISGSVRKPGHFVGHSEDAPDICIELIGLKTLLRALGLGFRRWNCLSELLMRILLNGNESLDRRLKALAHTWLGACYAVLLREQDVRHIHVHHGYFGSWIGMVAARLLGAGFSMTLHGSDLLVNGAYLDVKLRNCLLCVTISEYNQRFILQNFPVINRKAVVVSRLGVVAPPSGVRLTGFASQRARFTLLAAGRLHTIKNLPFLVHACARLRDLGLDFDCVIAGEGPAREHLELLIRGNRLYDRVSLLGHVPRDEMSSIYRSADLFVLTSLSEGIPVVLMEAMANGTIVLAPSITGIPELVIANRTGFLFKAGDLDDFVNNVMSLQAKMRSGSDNSSSQVDRMRQEAQLHVSHHFNHQKNLERFADIFLQAVAPHDWSPSHADPVLQ
jgi:colanic acid/amylovoran biosynthesis glycosyltransferase